MPRVRAAWCVYVRNSLFQRIEQNLQVPVVCPSHSALVTAAWATAIRIPPCRNASRTTAATRRSLYLCSRLPALCTHPSCVLLVQILIFNSVTAVGGTIHVPETAVDFSGGGFSNFVSSSSEFRAIPRLMASSVRPPCVSSGCCAGLPEQAGSRHLRRPLQPVCAFRSAYIGRNLMVIRSNGRVRARYCPPNGLTD